MMSCLTEGSIRDYISISELIGDAYTCGARTNAFLTVAFLTAIYIARQMPPLLHLAEQVGREEPPRYEQ